MGKMSSSRIGRIYSSAHSQFPQGAVEEEYVGEMRSNDTSQKWSPYPEDDDADMALECTECGYSTSSLENFYAHMSVHQDGERDQFTVNTDEYKRKDRHKLHTTSLENSAPDSRSQTHSFIHKCSLCSTICQSMRGLGIHTMRAHNVLTTTSERLKSEFVSEDKPLHMCSLCHFSTRNFSLLEAHIIKHVNPDTLMCNQCYYITSSSSTFEKHQCSHDINHGGKQAYKCDFCEYSALIPSKLKMHLMIHTGDRPFKCTFCNHSCKKLDHLKKHMRTHTAVIKKPFTCGMCSFASPDYGQLKRHLRCSHTDERHFKCDLCPYASTRANDLTSHMKRHMNEKQYKCPACDFACNSSSNLHVHVRTHSNEKPFKCGVCNYTCRESNRLKRHMMNKHLGERPFKCDICSHSFSHMHDLKRHRLVHSDEKPLKCSQCEYKCKRPDELKLHMKKHNEECQLKCKLCHFSTIFRKSLRKHEQRHVKVDNMSYATDS